MEKYKIGLLLIIVLFLISGCGYTKEEKQEMEKIKKQATDNAINYIEDKYGFMPTVSSVELDFPTSSPVINLTPSPTGFATVNLSYGEKDFKVFISGENETTDGRDDYQKDEIVKDIWKYLNNQIGLESSNYYIRYYDDNETKQKSYLIKELYIKDNLQTLFDKYKFDIQLDYINQSTIASIKNSNKLNNINGSLVLVNYNSLRSYNYLNDNDHMVYEVNDIEKYALYIKDVYVKNENKDDYIQFNVKQFDDIYYLDYPTINIGYTKMSDVSKFIGYGLGKEGAEIISKEYIISGDHEKTKIYFPALQYSSYDIDKINIGLECGDNRKVLYVNKIGEYLVGDLYISCDTSDVKFALMYSN